MSITAKELAKKLNISPTAVSLSLNNKPGVSRETRELVIREAEKYGYDFSRLSFKNRKDGVIYTIVYHAHNSITNYTPILSDLMTGIEQGCREDNYRMKSLQVFEKTDNLQKIIEDLRVSDCIGIILLGTVMSASICNEFLSVGVPMVLLDSYFDSVDCNYVLINNRQGAYFATDYIIRRTRKQPGHLTSSYVINNFKERKDGFNAALKEHGMAIARSITHELSPSIEGAFSDMLEIIESGTPLADCYFADNDFIAIGAMKALKMRGYKIPDDIAIIGFDDISEAKIIEPSLSTIHIPRLFMGKTAIQQLIRQIETPVPHTLKTEISTRLVKRFSV